MIFYHVILYGIVIYLLVIAVVLNQTSSFLGNPLHCNCFLRPVVYWLSSVGRLQGRGRSWDEAACAAPRHLEKRTVGSLIEEQLVCEDSEQASRFRLHPDIKFREVEMCVFHYPLQS